jgi:hypothetical protein
MLRLCAVFRLSTLILVWFRAGGISFTGLDATCAAGKCPGAVHALVISNSASALVALALLIFDLIVDELTLTPNCY